mmetsp:Transcript_58009/g.138095  ORF Transcript_58009/g.138095 Transcript_58009/m.138095 type:complete len:366 (+) Transcript_58009:66-1163(+)
MAEEEPYVSSSDAESDHSDEKGQSNAKVATTQMCPLELRFSQRKMRNVFADGKLLSDTEESIRALRRTPSEAEIYGAEWKLEGPFPPIEVLRWRCKLRDETTGRPLIDPKTGDEMLDDEESWFTLDNRRLCCLQRAAVKLWPERCTCDVVAEIPKGARRMREIRKFRTLDAGKSVMVGSKVDGVPFSRWAWRTEAQKKVKGHERGKSRKGGDGEAGEAKGAKGGKKGGKKGAGKGGGGEYYEGDYKGYSSGKGWSYGQGKSGGKGRKGQKGAGYAAQGVGRGHPEQWMEQDPAIVGYTADAGGYAGGGHYYDAQEYGSAPRKGKGRGGGGGKDGKGKGAEGNQKGGKKGRKGGKKGNAPQETQDA